MKKPMYVRFFPLQIPQLFFLIFNPKNCAMRGEGGERRAQAELDANLIPPFFLLRSSDENITSVTTTSSHPTSTSTAYSTRHSLTA